MKNASLFKVSFRNLLMFKFVIPALIQMISLSSNAQSGHNEIEFSPQASIAVFTANGNNMTGSAPGGEIIYHLDTKENQRTWIAAMNLKSIDFIFNYKNMSRITLIEDPKNGTFGDSYSILTALNLPLFRITGLDVDFSPGFGLTYAGQTWFTNANPVIGSHLSFASRMGLRASTSLSSTTKVSAGINILHYSNAGTRVPNNGMNVSSLSVGVIKMLKTNAQERPNTVSKTYFEDHFKRHTVDFAANIGRRGVYHSKDGLYKSGLYAGYNYRLNSILGLSTGIDAVYYYSVYDPAKNDETYQSKATSYDRWRVGAGVGPDLWMGRTAVMLKVGYYLHYNSLKPVNMYWTAGIKYHLQDWIALQAKLYVHGTEADFAGFGFNFTI
jgi:hypothetical protein